MLGENWASERQDGLHARLLPTLQWLQGMFTRKTFLHFYFISMKAHDWSLYGLYLRPRRRFLDFVRVFYFILEGPPAMGGGQ